MTLERYVMLKNLFCALVVACAVGCGGTSEPVIPENPTQPPSAPEKMNLPTGPAPTVEP